MSGEAPIKILRRSSGSSDQIAPSASSNPVVQGKSADERQAEYEAARKKIFDKLNSEEPEPEPEQRSGSGTILASNRSRDELRDPTETWAMGPPDQRTVGFKRGWRAEMRQQEGLDEGYE